MIATEIYDDEGIILFLFKPPNPGDDYEIHPSQAITIPESLRGEHFCVNVSTTSDTELEGDEQFFLNFTNLPSESYSVGTMGTVGVIIEDAGNPTSDLCH